jgi:hypothetical protein
MEHRTRLPPLLFKRFEGLGHTEPDTGKHSLPSNSLPAACDAECGAPGRHAPLQRCTAVSAPLGAKPSARRMLTGTFGALAKAHVVTRCAHVANCGGTRPSASSIKAPRVSRGDECFSYSCAVAECAPTRQANCAVWRCMRNSGNDKPVHRTSGLEGMGGWRVDSGGKHVWRPGSRRVGEIGWAGTCGVKVGGRRMRGWG